MLDYHPDTSLTPTQYASLMAFVERVLDAPDYTSIYDEVTRYFSSLGADAVNLGLINSQSGEMLGFSSNMNSDWLDFYVREGMAAHDPFLDHLTRSDNGAALGWNREGNLADLNDRSAEVYAECRSAGYTNLFMVPVKTAASPTGSAIIAANGLTGKDAVEFLQQQAGLITLASVFAGQQASMAFTREQAGKNWISVSQQSLSARETEVLKWLAAGLRTDQIAHTLDLKPVTVHLHITNARRKLGARTREQLMCMAMAQGLI